MNISAPFIQRPVATSLLMVGLLLCGLVAYRLMPVAALPNVDYPTIQISAQLPGADPQTMASSVATPLEQQLSQIPGLAQLTSSSALGFVQLTAQFELSRTVDSAAVDVLAAINAASPYLPANMPYPPTIRKVNPADTPIILLALTSDTLPLTTVDAYAENILLPKISQISGVGQVGIGGQQKPAIRVQVNPQALASRGLSLEDVRTVLGRRQCRPAQGNAQQPAADLHAQYQRPASEAGSLRQSDHRLSQRRAGAHSRRRKGDRGARKQPAGRLAQQAARHHSRHPARARRQCDRDRRQHQGVAAAARGFDSAGHQGSIASDRTTTIRASVADVRFTLILTIALVVMVIFLFLRNFWATVIPGITVPLSLIGTFAVLYEFGYSLDNLSLMALTIAVGFVVDDAVVVIENIVRHLEEGLSPMEAALKGSREIGFTIVSITLSLIAVFIPLFFMGGYVGKMFREFAVAVSVSLVLSLVISLTLTPMMCARLLNDTRKAGTAGSIGCPSAASMRCSTSTSARLKFALRLPLRHAHGDVWNDRFSPAISITSSRRASSRCRIPACCSALPRPRRIFRFPRWRNASRP